MSEAAIWVASSRRFDREVALRPGYFIKYRGQFENQERATRRLSMIVRLAIRLISVRLHDNRGARGPASSGFDGGIRRQFWFHSDGAFQLYRCAASVPGQLDDANVVFVAGAL
jgi:hypothetical protein